MTNLSRLEKELTDLDDYVDVALTLVAGRIWSRATRRMLMTIKEDIQANLKDALVKVRAQKDVEAGLRTALTALQGQQQAALDKITELQNAPGQWTDQDVADIKADMQALHDAFDPAAVTAAVMANTAEGAGSAAGSGNAG